MGIMPLMNAPLSIQERIERLNEILKICPEYYPALIELGYRHIQEGRDEIGKISIQIEKNLKSIYSSYLFQPLIILKTPKYKPELKNMNTMKSILPFSSKSAPFSQKDML